MYLSFLFFLFFCIYLLNGIMFGFPVKFFAEAHGFGTWVQLVYNFVSLKSFCGKANWGKEVLGVMSLGTVLCPWFPLCHEGFQ